MHKILIIEDDFLLLDYLKEALKYEGYKVITARNGIDGIDSARNDKPDLIISDINMPGMDGLDVLKKLQEDSHTGNIPFIFLTGKIEMEDLRRGMSLGADDYLLKPVNADELKSAIETRLKKHQKITQRFKDEITKTRLSLEQSLNYDDLTGLPKKAVLEKKITELKSTNTDNREIALILVKFDRIRGIVDVLGPTLVKHLLTRITEVLDETQQLYWIDSDEFGILLVEGVHKYELNSTAEMLLKNIRRTFIFNDQELHFTASIGISYQKLKKTKLPSLFSEAELALNYAVEKGFNNYQFYESAIKKHVFNRIRLESALHRAVERKEFVIHYQPKIQLIDEKVVGLEALVRWNHRDFGMVSPSQFIPLAENYGLINEIGDWLIQSICRQITVWKEQGMTIPRVAINVSGGQLKQNDFYERVSNIISQNGILGNQLEIELTESILVNNSEETARKLSEIKKLGINISIDDFGTGYSSLQYLKNFPHDNIKIDQSFIRELTVDKNSASIVTAIISMAHKLGVRVTAEGVENGEQVEFLRKHKCDEIQGFYYSKPVGADRLPELIKNVN